MSSNPELGRFDTLDIYADESRDGKIMNYQILKTCCFHKIKYYYIFVNEYYGGLLCSQFKLLDQKWIL